MQIREQGGWIRAGLAVLVAGVLGGGVLAVVGGTDPAGKVAADGVATGQPAGAASLPPARPPDDPAPKVDPKVGDKVLMGDDGGSVTVLAVEDNVSAGRLFGAGPRSKFVAAEVKGCSGPNEKNITFEPAWFLLRLDDGTIRDPGPEAKKPSLEGGRVPAGKCLSGWVTFTVPDGALPTGVIYDGSVRTTWTVPLPQNAKPTTTTTPKSGTTTSTTARPTATTARANTATTSKPTTTSGRVGSTTTAPKASASTTATSKSSGSTTAATSKSSGSTATTSKSSGSTAATSKSSGSTAATSKSSGSTAATSKSTSSTANPASTTSEKG